MNVLKYFITPLIILGFSFSKVYAQDNLLDSLLNQYEFKAAKKYITETKFNDEDLQTLAWAIYFSKKKNVDSAFFHLNKIDSTDIKINLKPFYFEYLGKTFNSNNQEDISLPLFHSAQKIYQKLGLIKRANEMNYQIYSTLESQEFYNYPKQAYLERFEENAILNNYYDQIGSVSLDKSLSHFSKKGRDSAFYYFNRAFRFNKLVKDPIFEGRIHAYIGLFYMNLIDSAETEYTNRLNIDSSLYHFKKELNIIKPKNINFREYYNFINQAHLQYLKKDYVKAIEILKEVGQIKNQLYEKNNNKIVYRKLSENYEALNKPDSAFYYLKKHLNYRDSVNVSSQNANLTRFQAEKKEKDILLEQQKKDRNRNIAIGLAGLLILGGIIAMLLQKNTKRKQRIAEQEREIEIQKTEKILKEQELNTIDAMLAGQEKERQKLAEDLHDSVGATLVAAKLQFNHLSQHRDNLKEMDELFSKTGVLLDDAYTEIRSMAHLKNSGVIAKNGLIPALQKLAKNASSTNGLQVTVENFGLEQRLDNTQEITIFRIVQELITNIIKHAAATEANVSLTPHENELSIIIEDNGKGFIPRTIVDKSGMGLANIERRVEHIEGTMEIDSTPGNGTTILIDIPL